MAGPPAGGVLAICPTCRLLSCEACWPGASATCAACTAAAAAVQPVAEPRALQPLVERVTRRPAVMAGVVFVAAVAILAIAFLPRNERNGAVGAATAAPAGSRSGGAAVAPSSTDPTTTPAATMSPDRGAGPSGSPDVRTTPTTPGATPEPAGDAPARLDVTVAVARPWVDPFGQVRVQVLAGVTNRGGSSGEVPPAGTTYRILSPSGATVSAGRFAHVFPARVEPGATAWFIDTISATFGEITEVGSVDVALADGATGDGGAGGRPAPAASLAPGGHHDLAVTADWTTDAAGALVASGEVRNAGTEVVDRVAIGVVVLGPDGAPLAGAYDVEDVRDLPPGASASFSTSYPGSAPFDPRKARAVEAFAVALPD